MALTTTTTATTVIPTISSRLTEDAREENLVIAPTFDHSHTSELREGGSAVTIQGISNFAVAGTLGVGGTVSYTAGSFASQITLTVDTHAYMAFDLEYEADLLANIDLMQKLSGKAGYSVALKIDDDCAGMFDDFSTNTVGTLAVPTTDADVRLGIQYLNDSITPPGERFYVNSPAQQMEFYAIDKYINALYKPAVGSTDTSKFRGQFADLYGLSWIMTGNVEGSNAAGHDNGMYHRSAVSIIILEQARVVRAFEIDTDSNKVAVHAIYGMVEVRDNHGVFMRGA